MSLVLKVGVFSFGHKQWNFFLDSWTTALDFLLAEWGRVYTIANTL
jgi:hypothetical protein